MLPQWVWCLVAITVQTIYGKQDTKTTQGKKHGHNLKILRQELHKRIGFVITCRGFCVK